MKNRVTNNINTAINKRVKSLLPIQLQYIFGVYLLGLIFFLFFRLIIFAIHVFTSFSDINLGLTIRSLFVGLRFDTVVSCYILSVFLILMSLAACLNINKRYFYRPIHYLITLIYAVVFLVCAIDVPYFNYFSNHLNIVSFLGVNGSKFIVNLIIENPIFILYGVIYLLSMAAYLWLMYCLYNATLFKTIPPYTNKQNIFKVLGVSLFMFLLCFVGARGRITEKSPIKIGTAYFSNSDFFNQLGLNPNFTLFYSWQENKKIENKPINLIDNITAKSTVDQEFINRDDSSSTNITLPQNSNVVLIIMDDISIKDFSIYGHKKVATPNINNIIKQSLSFTNIYSSSLDYYNGIYSTLFAYPTIFSHNAMKSTIISKMKGLPNVLKDEGYNTFYFSSTDRQENNISGFLFNNDIDKIIEQKPLLIFEKAIESLNNYNQDNERPFFACIFSANNTVKQTDKLIGKFIRQAKQSSWFKNTLFVFVSDNGKDENEVYSINQLSHHIPLMFYYPNKIIPGSNSALGLQVDVAPTILTLINKSYKNETMGLNLFNNQRSYAYFSSNNSIGVMDSVFLYVWRNNGKESLYKYKTNDKVNYLPLYKDKAKEMKTYGFSMLQYSQYNLSQIQILKQK